MKKEKQIYVCIADHMDSPQLRWEVFYEGIPRQFYTGVTGGAHHFGGKTLAETITQFVADVIKYKSDDETIEFKIGEAPWLIDHEGEKEWAELEKEGYYRTPQKRDEWLLEKIRAQYASQVQKI